MNRKFFMGLALCALSFPCLAGSVVVGADSPAGALDAEAVKRVFLGREATVGGKPAVVVYQKAGATKSAFESGVLGRSGADLAGYWSKLIFTGKAKAPEELSGDAAVKAKVASTPGRDRLHRRRRGGRHGQGAVQVLTTRFPPRVTANATVQTVAFFSFFFLALACPNPRPGAKAPAPVGGRRALVGWRIAWLRRPWPQQATAGHPWPAGASPPGHDVLEHLQGMASIPQDPSARRLS